MVLSMRLQVRQTQSLAMTPQLLQSIRLLQYHHLDLAEFLRREAERNPFLELKTRAPASSRGPAGMPGLEPAGAGEPPSLPAHALSEISQILPGEPDRLIAEGLLVDLDEVGYLRVEPAKAAGRLGVAPERIEAILAALRDAAEPAGLFAADLADCLSLQLRRQGRLGPVEQRVLSRLDLVARRDIAALCRLTGALPTDIAAIIRQVQRLDPRPGLAFETPERGSLQPDVIVAPSPSGGWRVSLNPQVMPRLLVNEDYVRTVEASCVNEAERAFVGECRTSAKWLAKALDQRARSTLKVACEIVRRQEAFLNEGRSALAPMTLASVGAAAGLHESTVSRVAANKCIATPQGVFELKFFFSAALAATRDDGAAASSATAVRERIRRLVSTERADAVLSDDDIAARLRAEGVEVARRTVAKYREALGIESSAKRRRILNFARLAS